MRRRLGWVVEAGMPVLDRQLAGAVVLVGVTTIRAGSRSRRAILLINTRKSICEIPLLLRRRHSALQSPFRSPPPHGIRPTDEAGEASWTLPDGTVYLMDPTAHADHQAEARSCPDPSHTASFGRARHARSRRETPVPDRLAWARALPFWAARSVQHGSRRTR